jgi:hypothetical protein
MDHPAVVERIRKRLASWDEVKESNKPEDLADAVFISNIFAEDVRYLLEENEQLVKALEAAGRHIGGNAETFVESERKFVLHLILEALTPYKTDND